MTMTNQNIEWCQTVVINKPQLLKEFKSMTSSSKLKLHHTEWQVIYEEWLEIAVHLKLLSAMSHRKKH